MRFKGIKTHGSEYVDILDFYILCHFCKGEVSHER